MSKEEIKRKAEDAKRHYLMMSILGIILLGAGGIEVAFHLYILAILTIFWGAFFLEFIAKEQKKQFNYWNKMI
jgi:hypothetical protein